jgi:radical SAM protein with 4Fe4S-binding SPASM domain
METISYADFSSRFDSGSSVKRIPMYGMFEVTRRCPLKCAHCYNNQPLNDQEALHDELTFDEHCRIVDELTDAGCLWLTYTGGEIFAREDFLDIYTHAKKKGLLVSLFTNGTLLTPETADYFSKLPPYVIEITLYGCTRETHEQVTRVPGSYEKSVEGIRLLAERKLPLRLKTMALTVNEHEIGRLRSFVEDELEIEFRFDSIITPRIDNSKRPLSLRLPPGKVIELDLQDSKKKIEWEKFAGRFNSCTSIPRADQEIFYCKAGITGFGIDPYGGLNLCLFSPDGKYDLRKGSFREGWEGSVLRERRRIITRQTKCTKCGIRDLCGMCPPNSQMEKGDPEEPVDFYCEVAHLRAQTFGITVKPHGECRYCTQGQEAKTRH